jgi:hypothetical protein
VLERRVCGLPSSESFPDRVLQACG